MRVHGETHQRPLDLFALERDQLRSLPELLYDFGAVNTLTAAKAAGQLKRNLRRYLRPRRALDAECQLVSPAPGLSNPVHYDREEHDAESHFETEARVHHRE